MADAEQWLDDPPPANSPGEPPREVEALLPASAPQRADEAAGLETLPSCEPQCELPPAPEGEPQPAGEVSPGRDSELPRVEPLTELPELSTLRELPVPTGESLPPMSEQPSESPASAQQPPVSELPLHAPLSSEPLAAAGGLPHAADESLLPPTSEQPPSGSPASEQQPPPTEPSEPLAPVSELPTHEPLASAGGVPTGEFLLPPASEQPPSGPPASEQQPLPAEPSEPPTHAPLSSEPLSPAGVEPEATSEMPSAPELSCGTAALIIDALDELPAAPPTLPLPAPDKPAAPFAELAFVRATSSRLSRRSGEGGGGAVPMTPATSLPRTPSNLSFRPPTPPGVGHSAQPQDASPRLRTPSPHLAYTRGPSGLGVISPRLPPALSHEVTAEVMPASNAPLEVGAELLSLFVPPPCTPSAAPSQLQLLATPAVQPPPTQESPAARLLFCSWLLPRASSLRGEFEKAVDDELPPTRSLLFEGIARILALTATAGGWPNMRSHGASLQPSALVPLCGSAAQSERITWAQLLAAVQRGAAGSLGGDDRELAGADGRAPPLHALVTRRVSIAVGGTDSEDGEASHALAASTAIHRGRQGRHSHRRMSQTREDSSRSRSGSPSARSRSAHYQGSSSPGSSSSRESSAGGTHGSRAQSRRHSSVREHRHHHQRHRQRSTERSSSTPPHERQPRDLPVTSHHPQAPPRNQPGGGPSESAGGGVLYSQWTPQVGAPPADAGAHWLAQPAWGSSPERSAAPLSHFSQQRQAGPLPPWPAHAPPPPQVAPSYRRYDEPLARQHPARGGPVMPPQRGEGQLARGLTTTQTLQGASRGPRGPLAAPSLPAAALTPVAAAAAALAADSGGPASGWAQALPPPPPRVPAAVAAPIDGTSSLEAVLRRYSRGLRLVFSHYAFLTKKAGLEPTFDSLASRGPSLNRAEFARCVRDVGLQGPLLSRGEVEAIARGLVTGHGSVLLDEAGFIEGLCRCAVSMMRGAPALQAAYPRDADKVAAVLRRAAIGNLPELNARLRAGGATPRALTLADFLRAEAGGRAAGGPESEEAGEAAAGGRRSSIADHRRASVADSGVGGRRASVLDSGVGGRQGAHAADSAAGDHHASSAADPGWAAMPAPSSEIVAGGRRGSAADDLGGTSSYRYEGPEEWGAASPLPEPPLRQAPLQAGLGGATRQRADAMLLLGEEEGSDAARAWSDAAPLARPPQPLVPTRGSVLVPIGARLPRLRPGA